MNLKKAKSLRKLSMVNGAVTEYECTKGSVNVTTRENDRKRGSSHNVIRTFKAYFPKVYSAPATAEGYFFKLHGPLSDDKTLRYQRMPVVVRRSCARGVYLGLKRLAAA